MTQNTPPDLAEPRPFTFDRIFSRVEDTTSGELAVGAERLTVADAAFEEGRKWGQEEKLAENDTRIATVLEKLSARIEQSLSRSTEQTAAHERKTVQLAYTIASKLAPALIARSPRVEIEALIEDCLRHRPNEPRILVSVSPEIILEIKTVLDRLAHTHGYKGKLLAVMDEDLTGDAIRIEWDSGAIVHDMAQTGQEIEKLINNHLDTIESGRDCPQQSASLEEKA